MHTLRQDPVAHPFDPRQRSCEGCGEALGARHAIGAAMRAAGNRLITVNATGCLEAFSTPCPDASWPLPWIHSLFGNAAAVATGVAAAQRIKGRGDVRVIAQGGDGGTADIGFGCLSGMFERNDDVLYICYDNEACMNSGGARSSTTPPAARTATTPALGNEPGNAIGTGKNLPLIAMAHRIPYVATASVADLPDLERKVTHATGLRGARYIHIHAPCPLGWGSAPADTVRIAQLAIESGLFPLFEAHDGRVTARTPLRQKVPVDEYLRLQARFAHLFDSAASRERIALIQAIADRNMAEFGLLE
jgi:pyruvate ferredoxin oxidoreductase beta subunit